MLALMVLSGVKGQAPPMRLFIRFHIKCELLLVPGGSPCRCEVWLEAEGKGGVGWGHHTDPADGTGRCSPPA